MKLITRRQETTLWKQARRSRADPERFHRRKPVVKISGGGVIWLITEVDLENPNRLFGLTCLEDGHAMGWVSRAEMESLPMERDLRWSPAGSLVQYWDAEPASHRLAAHRQLIGWRKTPPTNPTTATTTATIIRLRLWPWASPQPSHGIGPPAAASMRPPDASSERRSPGS